MQIVIIFQITIHSNSDRVIKFALMPTKTECDHFKCRRWNLVDAGFAPLNNQSKLTKSQIHNPVRATFVRITHDKLKTVN